MKIGFDSFLHRHIFALGLAFASLLLPVSGWAFKDATQVEFKLLRPASRVVTLSPALAETVAEVVGSDHAKLVGVSEYSDFPDWVKKVETVGAFQRANLEKIVALHPDLVIATTDGNSPDQISSLRRLGLTVLVIHTGTIAEWTESIRWIAEAIQGGNIKSLSESGILKKMETDLAKIDEVYTKVIQRKRVFVVLGVDPWITIGPKSLLYQVLDRAGFDLRFPSSRLDLAYPKYSREAVLSASWDYVWYSSSMAGAKLSPADLQSFEKKGVRVQAVVGDELMRPSSRMLTEVLKLQNKYLFDWGSLKVKNE